MHRPPSATPTQRTREWGFKNQTMRIALLLRNLDDIGAARIVAAIVREGACAADRRGVNEVGVGIDGYIEHQRPLPIPRLAAPPVEKRHHRSFRLKEAGIVGARAVVCQPCASVG